MWGVGMWGCVDVWGCGDGDAEMWGYVDVWGCGDVWTCGDVGMCGRVGMWGCVMGDEGEGSRDVGWGMWDGGIQKERCRYMLYHYSSERRWRPTMRAVNEDAGRRS